MKEGRAEGRAEGIIKTALSLGVKDDNKIATMLIEQLDISEAEAFQKIENYREAKFL